jgi:hypothetical protein
VSQALRNAQGAAVTLAAAATARRQLTEALDAPSGGLRVMTRAECLELLGSGSVGRMAYIARAGVPDIAVVNYAYDGRDVLIRTGPGPKLQAAERGDNVVLEVDLLDPVGGSGRSVLVHGVASRLTAAAAAAGLQPAPWAPGPRRHVIRIRPGRITGRVLGWVRTSRSTRRMRQ